jgi:hypothetical protein
VDPVLRVILLKGTIKAASDGSASLAVALSDHVRLIEGVQLNLNVDWVDPEDAIATRERNRADVLLARLPRFEPCAEKAKAGRQLLEKEIARVYWPAGILLRGQDGTWRCRSPRPIAPGTEFYAITPQRSWKQIGTASGNQGELGPESVASDLIEGRLVFSRRGAG